MEVPEHSSAVIFFQHLSLNRKLTSVLLTEVYQAYLSGSCCRQRTRSSGRMPDLEPSLSRKEMIKSSAGGNQLLRNVANKIEIVAVLSRHVISALRKSWRLKIGRQQLFGGFISM